MNKRTVCEMILQEGWCQLHLYANGATLPPHLSGEIALDIGYGLPVPIPDLVVDEYGVAGTLSFGGHPCWCAVPWTCIYGMMAPDRSGVVWPPDETKKYPKLRLVK